METIERLEKLIREFSFQQLNEGDRNWVLEQLESEEEYESLRKVNVQLDEHFSQKQAVVPDKATLTKIKSSLKQRNEKRAFVPWLSFKVPSYAVAAMLMVAGMFGWWLGSAKEPKEVFVERIKSQVDTVYIATKPDTVFRNKIIYMQASRAASNPNIESQRVQTVSRGINMKDKEELEKFLVEGSR